MRWIIIAEGEIVKTGNTSHKRIQPRLDQAEEMGGVLHTEFHLIGPVLVKNGQFNALLKTKNSKYAVRRELKKVMVLARSRPGLSERVIDLETRLELLENL